MQQNIDVEAQARTMLRNHGIRAAKVVLDLIVQAVRDFDMETARVWERVAVEIDRHSDCPYDGRGGDVII